MIKLIPDRQDDVPTANYDLPSPDKAAALAASSSDEVNGDAKKVNGAWTEDENDQWAAKAGWAPRFGSIDDMDRQESTLLDHQTWVETNLSDKFFGGPWAMLRSIHPSGAESLGGRLVS